MMCKHQSVSIPYQESNEYLFVTEQIQSIIGLIRSCYCYALLQILVRIRIQKRPEIWIRINLPGVARCKAPPARVMLTLCSLFSCKAVSEALELLCRPVGVLGGGPIPPLSPELGPRNGRFLKRLINRLMPFNEEFNNNHL